MATNENNAPVKVLRARGVKVSVFENRTENATFFKATVQRVYKDGEEFKTTNSLGRDDLPVARLLLQRAWEWILEAEAAGHVRQGAVSEAFLNAAQGEKVAFVEKTTTYIHKGAAMFDVPFNTGKAWQGQPEFDESSQTYAIQISVPVLADGKSIGALVVGVNLTHLVREEMTGPWTCR